MDVQGIPDVRGSQHLAGFDGSNILVLPAASLQDVDRTDPATFSYILTSRFLACLPSIYHAGRTGRPLAFFGRSSESLSEAPEWDMAVRATDQIG